MPGTDEPQEAPEEGNDPRPRAPGGRIVLYALAAVVIGFLAARYGYPLLRGRADAFIDFDTMNTYGAISVPRDSGSPEPPDELARAARETVERVNDLMSPFGDGSDVRRLNEAGAGRWVEVDPATWTVVMEALRWNRLTGGAFDPTVGPVKALFTFSQAEADAWPDAETLAEAGRRVGADKLLFDREGMRLAWAEDGMRLDLGAIAKGYAADLAAEVLRRRGVRHAMIDIGGELRVLGAKPGRPPTPWKVGLKNPRGDGILETLQLADRAVATSGDYERYFTYRGVRYEHIIDPRSGLPLANGVASVTVIHPSSCLAADALATSMCVLGPDEGLAFLERQALGLFASGDVRVIMLVSDGDGSFRKYDYSVDAAGGVASAMEVVRP